MNILLFFFQFLPTLGFLLALILLLHLLREQKPPSVTIAWLLVIIFVPYVGVPLYIFFGGRKMRKMTQEKDIVPINEQKALNEKENYQEVSPGGVSYIFPLREGNQVSLLLTGEDAFQQLMQYIENAHQSIYITTFILGNDDTGKAIIESLTRKAREGLEVCLLLDALGSHNISDDFLRDFKVAGGKYAFFMPMIHVPFRGRANLRNHRKMILIDIKVAIIGGMNLSHEYMGSKSDLSRWRDISLSVKGPIINDLYTVFHSDWKFAAKENLTLLHENTNYSESDNNISAHLLPSGPDVAGDPLYDTILTSMFNAQKRIWIVTPYFIPDDMLIKAICIAARRNVDVRIIVPKVSNHRLADMVRRNYLREIHDAGAKIFQFKPGMVHGKLIIIDDSPAIIGSMNIDMRSFFLNYEIALFIYSRQIVTQLDKWIYNLINESETGIKSVPVLVEYIEGIARLLAPLL